MTKLMLGVVATLMLMLAIGGWRYSVLLGDYGKLEQAAEQYQQTISDQEQQLSQLEKNRQAAESVSQEHYEKALRIKDQEMQEKVSLTAHKLKRLKHTVKELQAENNRLKNTMLKTGAGDPVAQRVNREEKNEKLSEKCIDMRIPDFYVNQL